MIVFIVYCLVVGLPNYNLDIFFCFLFRLNFHFIQRFFCSKKFQVELKMKFIYQSHEELIFYDHLQSHKMAENILTTLFHASPHNSSCMFLAGANWSFLLIFEVSMVKITNICKYKSCDLIIYFAFIAHCVQWCLPMVKSQFSIFGFLVSISNHTVLLKNFLHRYRILDNFSRDCVISTFSFGKSLKFKMKNICTCIIIYNYSNNNKICSNCRVQTSAKRLPEWKKIIMVKTFHFR